MKYLLEGQETERLLFRKVMWSDFDTWLDFHKNPITFRYWISEKESPENECQKWYEKQFNRYKHDLGGMNVLIEKQTGKLIGHAGLLVQNIDNIPELEVAYSLLPEFWSKGYATEAAKKCRDFAFENNYSDSLISIISLTNKPSENVALKNGMTIDKITQYNGNKVNVFRIHEKKWHKISGES